MADLVMDKIKLDGDAWIEIGVAFLAYFILSFLWWGPVMGRKWAAEMGMNMDEKPEGMTKSMILQVVGTALLAFVLWHVMMAFSYNVTTDAMTSPTVGDAMLGVLWTWLGFFVPVQLGKMAWEKSSWMLATINAVGNLIGLAGMGLAFALL